jgi:hypothetical protein
MRQLRDYVSNSLFPFWKFFSIKKQMVFSNRAGGIVLKICNGLHVWPESQMCYVLVGLEQEGYPRVTEPKEK